MANLASNLVGTVRARADRVAVRMGEGTTTYRELDKASASPNRLRKPGRISWTC
jgi:hypothetical protein